MRVVAAAVATLAAAACVEPGPDLASWEQASLVSDYETTTCSTAVVIELSRQIAAEVGCMVPGQLVTFTEGGGVVFAGSAVLPYVSETARTDLLAAVAEGGGTELRITSAYRTVVQQWLLYRWRQLGRCGITAAAVPGSSNHESGRAIDVSNYDAWITRLAAHDWAHSVPGDPVHFDHTMSADLRGTDVLAFQRLWNRNHVADLIDEDGDWGPMTEARVRMATAEGFPIGARCGGAPLDVSFQEVDAPRVMAPGEVATVTVTMFNHGTDTWPDDTALVTAEPAGRVSRFAAPSWPAPDRPAQLAPVPAGVAHQVRFEIVAPDVDEAEELAESFALASPGGGQRFGMMAFVVRVEPGGGEASGGCSAGGGSGAWIPLLGLLILGSRKRRFRSS
jgi:hypothetical protein